VNLISKYTGKFTSVLREYVKLSKLAVWFFFGLNFKSIQPKVFTESRQNEKMHFFLEVCKIIVSEKKYWQNDAKVQNTNKFWIYQKKNN
jgi:hypothetical protein